MTTLDSRRNIGNGALLAIKIRYGGRQQSCFPRQRPQIYFLPSAATTILPGETNTPIMDNRARPPLEGERGVMLNPHDVARAALLCASLQKGAMIPELHICPTFMRDTSADIEAAPHSHEQPILIRYLNAGADGLMVPMVDTADRARAIVDAVRYACPTDHEKRLIIGMIETPRAIDGIGDLLAVEGIDVFFIGPGDLSQNMGYPPAPPFGQPRPQAVTERVDFAVKKIGAAGKIAGTLVTSDELPFWLERGVRYFYVHSDPFLRVGLAGVRKMLGR